MCMHIIEHVVTPPPLPSAFCALIGRAIRHAKDYAVVLLVDHRYSRAGVQEKLPRWMGGSLKDCSGFGLAFASIRKVMGFCLR